MTLFSKKIYRLKRLLIRYHQMAFGGDARSSPLLSQSSTTNIVSCIIFCLKHEMAKFTRKDPSSTSPENLYVPGRHELTQRITFNLVHGTLDRVRNELGISVLKLSLSNPIQDSLQQGRWFLFYGSLWAGLRRNLVTGETCTCDMKTWLFRYSRFTTSNYQLCLSIEK